MKNSGDFLWEDKVAMTFDSLLIVDDSGKQQIVKFLIHQVKSKQLYKKRHNYVKEKIEHRKYKESCRKNGIALMKTNLWLLGKNVNNRSKLNKRIELKRKAEKYDTSNELVNRYFKTRFISKSTIRNLKKNLRKYGRYTIKRTYYEEVNQVNHEEYCFTAFDSKVYEHIYFYNSETKNKISVNDYINLNRMFEDKHKLFISDAGLVVVTNDKLCKFYIHIVFGTYDSILLIRDIMELPW